MDDKNLILVDIQSRQRNQNLGVMIDVRLRFREHVKYLNAKVGKIMKKLAIVFRNTFGYGNTAS